MRDHGHAVEVEVERAHGGYWWPLGLLNGGAALAGLAARRARSRGHGCWRRAIGASAAAAIWDEVGGGRLWFRRALLPHRDTFNVLGEAGDLTAPETVVVVAHHDAAHSGLVFHPALPRLFAERFPEQHERSKQSVPIMYATWLGPVLVALGALLGRGGLLRAGSVMERGAAVAMADIGRSAVVPGANDNLSAVACWSRSRARWPSGRRRRARAAALDGLGGVVHGGHAGLHAPPPRDARSGAHDGAVPGVRRQPDADAGRGGGHAADALLRRRGARAARARRPRRSAWSSCAACARSPPPTR